MASIREEICNIIAHRILPWIERDGVSKLLLPEQIIHTDLPKPTGYKPQCNLRHPEPELAIGLAGEVPYCINNKTFIFTPGRMVFLTPGISHGPVHIILWETKTIEIERSSLILWLTTYPFGVRVQVSRSRSDINALDATKPYMLLDRHVSTLMAWLAEEIGSRPPNYAGVARCILMEIMQRCVRAPSAAAVVDELAISSRQRRRGGKSRPRTRRRSSSPVRPAPSKAVGSKAKGRTTCTPAKDTSKQLPDRVQAAMEFIHSNYHTPIGLADIADAAHTSADYFCRLFKAATGTPPVRYLLNVRMAAARELLLTDLKVFEVARLVGIEDAFYFTRIFGRFNGVSPRQYRQQMARRMARAVKYPPKP